MYLIDGNNVIGQRGKGYETWYRDKPAARRQLLEELAHLAGVKKLHLSVVFDGAPEPHFPDGSSYRGVKLHYARPGSDADSRIVELVEQTRNRQALVVVTSDKALTARVRVCGVRVLRSGAFRLWLEEARQSPKQPRPSAIKTEEMGEWLRYFGVAETDDAEEDEV
jgi:predicted RNA-binding protein with PIN domain